MYSVFASFGANDEEVTPGCFYLTPAWGPRFTLVLRQNRQGEIQSTARSRSVAERMSSWPCC